VPRAKPEPPTGAPALLAMVCSRALTAPRLIAPLLAALAVLAGCGDGERQDADEPEGTFRVEVAEASFPERQSIAERSTMRIRVRNPDRKTLPNVAVTVETKGATPGAGAVSFAQAQNGPRLADPNRPVWILDSGPVGGTSAYANTWSLGPLESGQTKTFVWKLTAVEAGDYSIGYRVSPGLDGKARLASGSRARGSFDVTISDEPVPARVDDGGDVVRGEQAGAGAN
jgi:hypothetical protein